LRFDLKSLQQGSLLLQLGVGVIAMIPRVAIPAFKPNVYLAALARSLLQIQHIIVFAFVTLNNLHLFLAQKIKKPPDTINVSRRLNGSMAQRLTRKILTLCFNFSTFVL
jgi:hypothetical protein